MAYEYLSKSTSNAWKAENQVLAKTIVANAQKRSPAHATFLSHSTKDAELLPVAIRILENHGATIYIDKKDSSLPPYTNRDTATKLRNRINQSKKFVLLASDNSRDSRWVPWELGLADGCKKQDNVAIFPAVENQSNTSWTNWEYLGIYNRIVYGDLQYQTARVWMVLNQELNTATELAAWLAK